MSPTVLEFEMTHYNDPFHLTLSTQLFGHPNFSYVGHPLLANCSFHMSHVRAVTAALYVPCFLYPPLIHFQYIIILPCVDLVGLDRGRKNSSNSYTALRNEASIRTEGNRQCKWFRHFTHGCRKTNNWGQLIGSEIK